MRCHLAKDNIVRGIKRNARLSREWERGGHTVAPFTFTRQYPDFLFPGKTQMVTADDKADLFRCTAARFYRLPDEA